jgi:hypothetical protein
VASVEDEVAQLRYGDLIDRFRDLMERHGALLTGICAAVPQRAIVAETAAYAVDLGELLALIAERAGLAATGVDPVPLHLAELKILEAEAGEGGSLLDSRTARLLAFAWLSLHRLGDLEDPPGGGAGTAELVARFGLGRPLQEALYGEVTEEDDPLATLDVPSAMALFRLLLRWQEFFLPGAGDRRERLARLLADRDVALFIGRHWSGSHEWFIKERWEILVQWLRLAAGLLADTAPGTTEDRLPVTAVTPRADELLLAAETAAYRIDLLLTGVAA